MTWYAARLLYRRVFSGEPLVPLPPEEGPELDGEESIIVLQCLDEAEAREEAERLGKAQAHRYRNPYGETVSWEFVKVLDVCDPVVTAFEHGTEVYSRFLFKNELQDAAR